MTNEAFQLLSDEEKNTKFKAILNTRTAGCLSSEELKRILLAVSVNKQYCIKVYVDKEAFQSALQLEKGYRGKTVLGQALASYRTVPGKLYSCTGPAAIISHNQLDEKDACHLLIFIPQERIQKG